MLKVRRVGIDSPHENVVFLARHCISYRPEEFQALEKIEVSTQGRRVLAILNVVDNSAIVKADEVGLGEQAFRHFGMPEGTLVELPQATAPQSLESIRRKIRGHTLDAGEFNAIVRDIAANRYSKTEIAVFLIFLACFATDFKFATEYAAAASGYTIASTW